MEVKKLDENGPVIITPTIYSDERGYFYESFNDKEFRENVCDTTFVQDNQSRSSYGVLRGLHFQNPPYEQAKLVRVVKGAVFDVVVDLRKDSKNYLKWYWCYLSEENNRQFFVPRGFAHSFVSLSDETVFQYKCDNPYDKASEGSIRWNDQTIGIDWEKFMSWRNIKLSTKDMKSPFLKDIEKELTF